MTEIVTDDDATLVNIAEELLRSCGVEFSRVIRVCMEDGAILFLREGRVGTEFPLTAWTEVMAGQMCVRVQMGWEREQRPGLAIRAPKNDSRAHEQDPDQA